MSAATIFVYGFQSKHNLTHFSLNPSKEYWQTVQTQIGR